jgi:predicted enzyme related to lactoylglutathione lyase
MATIQTIITTTDLDRLLHFYQQVFGATEVLRVPEEGDLFYLFLTVGDSELGLVVNDKAASGEQRIALSVEVPDVDDALARIEPAGGTVLGPPNDMPWGQRVAHCTDPDGNKVNLTNWIQPPG